jgi:hypothetical protein
MFRGRKFQDIREAHVTGDEQAVFALSIFKNFIVAFALQACLVYVYNVKTRVTENAGR